MRSKLKKVTLLLLALACSACSTDKPPNIILVLADELGFGDVGAYGATLIKTPNIDTLG